jgi:hypothetical protein
MSESIFEKILDTKSRTAIEIKTEEAIKSASGKEKDALERIWLCNKLDEIYRS